MGQLSPQRVCPPNGALTTLPAMAASPPASDQPDALTAHYRSGERLRSRSVGAAVPNTTLALPALPARLVADWEREMTQHMALEAGDVEPLPLARARARWPDFRRVLQAMAQWAGTLGLADALADGEMALMACRGARYHHDAAHYGAAAFCNLFVGEDKGLDVHFPLAGQRIALVRGTALLFDTAQPHAVVPRGSSRFDAADFAPGCDCSQYFLSWELPIEQPAVARLLQVRFDVAPSTTATTAQPDEPQVRRHGTAGALCPLSGRWIASV